jgi:hypothetical protein
MLLIIEKLLSLTEAEIRGCWNCYGVCSVYTAEPGGVS